MRTGAGHLVANSSLPSQSRTALCGVDSFQGSGVPGINRMDC